MINTEYTISNLTKNSVTVLSQKYYDGLKLGDIHAKSYVNSYDGRTELQNDVSEIQIVNAVFTVWGEVPTVDEEMII